MQREGNLLEQRKLSLVGADEEESEINNGGLLPSKDGLVPRSEEGTNCSHCELTEGEATDWPA